VRAVLEDDRLDFAARMGPFLRSRPVEHNVLVTVLEHAGDDALLAWVADDRGEPAAVAIRTPPMRLLVSTLADDNAAEALADALREHKVQLPGVTGPEPAVSRVAKALDPRARPGMSQAVYALSRVVAPERVAPGARRRADAADRDLLVAWTDAFQREAHAAGDAGAMVDQRLRSGALWLWEVDGEPVCLVGRSSAVVGVVRVGPVWTPPDLRGRGYASALVAFACSRAMEEGAERCMLFADLGNPTSNAIYRRVGFERVGDAREWDVTHG
jgi:predicted GNAT family acetyltransferase